MTNLCIRCSDAIYKDTGISSTLIYINTKENLADPISQGELPPYDERISFPIPLPTNIARFFINV